MNILIIFEGFLKDFIDFLGDFSSKSNYSFTNLFTRMEPESEVILTK